MHDEDPTLGEIKSNLTVNDGFVRSDWVDKMNGCGKRKYPTLTLAKDTEIWEKEFEKFHELCMKQKQTFWKLYFIIF